MSYRSTNNAWYDETIDQPRMGDMSTGDDQRWAMPQIKKLEILTTKKTSAGVSKHPEVLKQLHAECFNIRNIKKQQRTKLNMQATFLHSSNPQEKQLQHHTNSEILNTQKITEIWEQ